MLKTSYSFELYAAQKRNKQQPVGLRTQGPNKTSENKVEVGLWCARPKQRKKEIVWAWGVLGPKNGGVSVIRKMVKLISVSVSVHEKPKIYRRCRHTYIDTYIYTVIIIVIVNIYIMSYIY